MAFFQGSEVFQQEMEDNSHYFSIWGIWWKHFAWSDKTTKTGGLMHISLIGIKPKTLGAYLNNVECSKTAIMICIVIQRGKKSAFYYAHTYLKPTTSCYLCLDEIFVSSGYHIFSPLVLWPILRLRQIYFRETSSVQAFI